MRKGKFLLLSTNGTKKPIMFKSKDIHYAVLVEYMDTKDNIMSSYTKLMTGKGEFSISETPIEIYNLLNES